MEVKGMASGEVHTQQEPIVELPRLQKRFRRRNIIIFVVVSMLNVALLILLWTLLLTPSQRQSGSTSSDLGDYTSPLLGKPASNFNLTMLNGSGEKIQLASFKGRPVVLNFWASWCGPCNDEAPFLQKNVPQLQSQGIVFLGVEASEKAGVGQAFLKKYALNYPNVQDTLTGSTAIDYGATGFPTTVFINRAGVIAAIWNGPLTAQGLRTELAKITS